MLSPSSFSRYGKIEQYHKSVMETLLQKHQFTSSETGPFVLLKKKKKNCHGNTATQSVSAVLY